MKKYSLSVICVVLFALLAGCGNKETSNITVDYGDSAVYTCLLYTSSGGELSRLKLCILMDEEVNLLILDEPTNHLDIASRGWIEEAVESYCLLYTSQSRYRR